MEHARAMSSLVNFTGCRGDRRKVSLDSLIFRRPAFCWRRGRRVPSRNEKVNAKRLGSPRRAGSTVLLVVQGMGAAEVVENVTVEGAPSRGFIVSDGFPEPFGATVRDGGVNFAIFSSGATSASLCLFSSEDLKANKVTEQIPLDPAVNKTGHIWHIFLQGEFHNLLYGYTFDGPFSPKDGHYFDSSLVLLDPYAKAVVSRGEYGVQGPGGNCWPQMAGMIPSSRDEFDWEGDLRLSYPQRDLIIYEMHVRGFTRHDSSGTKYPGTYLGVTEKLDHLKELGVNCIELMPCHEFNELEYFSYNSATGENKFNFWGYSTVNFFSPMIRYSSAGLGNCGLDAINEFKFLVREAHKRGIEVLLDVVFNHTAEGNERGPIFSFRGLDNSVYYMIAPKGEFYNYSGCGNTFNCNHPIVRQFIVDCLRYWVIEMHVDGFRFDLASIMTRASSNPPLIEMISDDPILSKVKVNFLFHIMGCWGLYQVGKFPHGGVWSEWNGQYRDVVRQFIKGTNGFSGAFAKCICGSPNLYQDGGRKPWNSVNFVCAHDGFTLADLVTYNRKNNLSNGENNNDGENHNNSWNCGQEGETAALPVLRLRKRQMRNFFLCLMVSQGVPMILMGDEYGHTKGGNNNTYCHDNYLNYFRWDQKEESSGTCSDFRAWILTRRRCRESDSLGLNDFPTAERLQWHGLLAGKPDWSETSRIVAFSLRDSVKGEIYVAFNASHLPVTVALPERPGQRWEPLVDTGKAAPYDFLFAHFLDANLYPMLSYSSVILLLHPDSTAA
ncbi:unnamed protein product [Spirodela intermedia]|uniref:isoamylase n=1 Tax=Spirodela intermedia TaxID=51605 RepID=A0A7I8JMY7_SPIIN|nr:unnamed protein product [Spirodela intermedia]CAA6671175.1 unnamed protein product [Spirodela intermedia]